jgi:hypothetical protein
MTKISTKKQPVEIYHNISNTQLSVARHYGGCTINGESYTYNPTDDTLVLTSSLKKKTKK